MFELSSNDLTKLASGLTSVDAGELSCVGRTFVSGKFTAANLFIPNKFQVSNESLILAQNQRWRRA